MPRPAFDHEKLAAALSSAGLPADGSHLPIHGFEISPDRATLSFDAASKHWSCDLQGGRCAEAPARDAGEAPSPDGQRAVFVRDYNLWVRNLATGKELQLTTDGVKDFGYATDNPGWAHSNRAIVAWAPDSRRLATFQQDQRGVGEMYLVRTKPGHPELESWKYAMAGDETIATIQRVIIDVDSGKLVRLQVPPGPASLVALLRRAVRRRHSGGRAMSPDSASLAFVSTSRDHKRAQLRVADAATGAVREVLDEQAATTMSRTLRPPRMAR